MSFCIPAHTTHFAKCVSLAKTTLTTRTLSNATLQEQARAQLQQTVAKLTEVRSARRCRRSCLGPVHAVVDGVRTDALPDTMCNKVFCSTPGCCSKLGSARPETSCTETGRWQLQTCWDKCMGSPGNYLSSRESACFENCAKRFLETTQLIMQVAPSRLTMHVCSGNARACPPLH